MGRPSWATALTEPAAQSSAWRDGYPLVVVLSGVTVPLVFLIVAISKPALSYWLAAAPPADRRMGTARSRHRRSSGLSCTL